MAAQEIDDRKPTVEEMVGSLTGFDEIAIEQKFKSDLNGLTPTTTARALSWFRAFAMVDPRGTVARWSEVRQPICTTWQ